MEQRQSALWRALAALAGGHFVAMLGVLLPFALMAVLVDYQKEIRIGAALIVIAMGLYIAITRRHPRMLSRIPPSKLALWSFLVALAHGAALMLVPIYLGLCGLDELDAGHRAVSEIMATNGLLVLAVAAIHTAAMILGGGLLAYAVYRWLGLQFLSRSWFNLELIWALSLILVGVLGLWSALG
jgi:cytochrome c biogenesis protein CcdA